MSPAYQLHPEFGLLCPSRSLRRKTRAVLAFLAIVALLAWNAAHRPETDGAIAVAHDDATQFSADTVGAVGETTGIKTADGPRPPEESKTACAGDAWSYIDGKCSIGTARKLPRSRAANETPTIAALPIGRSSLPAPESSQSPEEPLGATDGHAAKPVAEPAPAVAERAGAPAPTRRKVQKPSHRNSGHDLVRDWRWRDEQWTARAYAPDDRYLRDRYERSWGWGPMR